MSFLLPLKQRRIGQPLCIMWGIKFDKDIAFEGSSAALFVGRSILMAFANCLVDFQCVWIRIVSWLHGNYLFFVVLFLCICIRRAWIICGVAAMRISSNRQWISSMDGEATLTAMPTGGGIESRGHFGLYGKGSTTKVIFLLFLSSSMRKMRTVSWWSILARDSKFKFRKCNWFINWSM